MVNCFRGVLLIVVLGVAQASFASEPQTRLSYGQCVTSDYSLEAGKESAGLVATIASGVISQGLKRFGAALRNAGEAKDTVTSVTSPIELAPKVIRPCVTLAHGRWQDQAAGAWSGNLKVAEKFLAAEPQLLLEFNVVPDASGTAIRLQPSTLIYRGSPGDARPGRRGTSRGMAISVSVSTPQKPDEGIGGSIVLGDYAMGYRYNLATGVGVPLDAKRARDSTNNVINTPLQYTSVWFPSWAAKAPTAAATKEKKKTAAGDKTDGRQKAVASVSSSGAGSRPDGFLNGSSPQADAPATADKVVLLPRNMQFTLTETRHARKILLFLADVFDDSQAELQKTAELALLKSKREEAIAAAATAELTATNNFLNKYGAAEAARITYCAATTDLDRVKGSQKAATTMREADLAAQLIGESPRFLNYPTISGDEADRQNYCI